MSLSRTLKRMTVAVSMNSLPSWIAISAARPRSHVTLPVIPSLCRKTFRSGPKLELAFTHLRPETGSGDEAGHEIVLCSIGAMNEPKR